MTIKDKDINKQKGSKARKIGIAVAFVIAAIAVACAIAIPAIISRKNR